MFTNYTSKNHSLSISTIQEEFRMCVVGMEYRNATVMCLLMTLGWCQELCSIHMIHLGLHITKNLG